MDFDRNCAPVICDIYQRFYNAAGELIAPSATRDDVYNRLTTDRCEAGNAYFELLDTDRLQYIAGRKLFDTGVILHLQKYYIKRTGNTPLSDRWVNVRVVVNVDTQGSAIDVVSTLSDMAANQIGKMIYTYKVLLGVAGSNPVKRDKIVIYLRVPIPTTSGGVYIFPQISILLEMLSFYANPSAAPGPLIPFAKQYLDVDVAYGEGINYNGQEATFSEPRADAIYSVLASNLSCSCPNFSQKLAKAFDQRGLSIKLPFANKGSEKYIWG